MGERGAGREQPAPHRARSPLAAPAPLWGPRLRLSRARAAGRAAGQRRARLTALRTAAAAPPLSLRHVQCQPRLAALHPAGLAAPRGHTAPTGPNDRRQKRTPLRRSSLRATTAALSRPAFPVACRATHVLRVPRHACSRALSSRGRSRAWPLQESRGGGGLPVRQSGRRARPPMSAPGGGRAGGEMELAAPRGVKWLITPCRPLRTSSQRGPRLSHAGSEVLRSPRAAPGPRSLT